MSIRAVATDLTAEGRPYSEAYLKWLYDDMQKFVIRWLPYMSETQAAQCRCGH